MFSLLFRFPLAAVPRGRCRRSRTPPARALTFGEGVWLAAFAVIGLAALAGSFVVPPGGGQDVVFDLFLLAGTGVLIMFLYVVLTPTWEDDEPEPPMPVLHERIRPPNRQLPRDGRPPHRPYTGEFDLGDD